MFCADAKGCVAGSVKTQRSAQDTEADNTSKAKILCQSLPTPARSEAYAATREEDETRFLETKVCFLMAGMPRGDIFLFGIEWSIA